MILPRFYPPQLNLFNYKAYDFLSQGDIFEGIPFTRVEEDGSISAYRGKGMLISNTCSADHDDEIVLAPLLDIDLLGLNKTDIVNNLHYRLLYLPDKRYENYVVDFSLLNTFNKDVLNRINDTIGEDTPDIVYLGFESVGEAIQGKFIPNEENSVKEKRISTWKYENVWDVLWNRKFILNNNIEFIEGKFFEDFVFYYKGVLKSNSYKYTDYISIIYNSGRADSMSTAISPIKLKDLYFNMICLLDVLEEVEPKYKTYIVDALKRNNDYINRLLENLR